MKSFGRWRFVKICLLADRLIGASDFQLTAFEAAGDGFGAVGRLQFDRQRGDVGLGGVLAMTS
jgi:hypothetical protein